MPHIGAVLTCCANTYRRSVLILSFSLFLTLILQASLHTFFSAKYASATILSTVSAISYSHKIVGLADPADNFYIKKLLVGVQTSSGKVDSRKPIDLHMLGQLVHASKAVIPEKFTQLCIAAMFMLVFHGFLRIGEITVRPGVSSDHVVQRSDLVIVSNRKRSSLQLTIRHAKHQAVGRPIVLEIHAQANNCPVSHISQYLNTRGPSPGPLFILPNRSPISRACLASQLTACLYKIQEALFIYKIQEVLFNVGYMIIRQH